MSDYDFLWEMRDLGYSNEEIIEAAACGYCTLRGYLFR